MPPDRPALDLDALRRDPLFIASPLPKWVFDDRTLAFLAVNPAACERYGWSEEEFLGMTLGDIRPPEDVPWLRRVAESDLMQDVAHFPVVQHRRRDGTLIHVDIHARAVTLDGRAAHLVVVTDITGRILAEDGLRLHAKAVEASASAVLVTDARAPDMPLVLVNPAFERITGYRADEVIGRNCRFLQEDDQHQAELDVLRAAIREQRTYLGVLRNYRRSGEFFWNELSLAPLFDERGELTHYVGIMNDITQRRTQQMELEYRDRHDELTGLPNRRQLMEIIERLVARCDAEGAGGVVQVAMVNIDHLHLVNDTLGYDAGDAVIRDVGRRMLNVAMRHGAFAGRIGGDEFVLVSHHPDGEASPEQAEEAIAVLARPFVVAGSPIHLTASVGSSVYPATADSAQALIQQAHLAGRKAKAAGRNQGARFTAEMAASVADRLTLGNALRVALAGRQLELQVQPLVHAASGRLGGGEALLRWTHPTLGPISPARFVPLAEDTGLIVDIGAWALAEALKLAGGWTGTALHPAPALAVNVSAVQFRRRGFVREVLDAVAASRVPASSLKLEITESVVMEDADQAIGMLSELRAAGVRISMDDFGTGHSSLGYLRQLPLDELKIDRVFVRDVTTDPMGARLCATIIDVSRALGLRVVAEGVETPDQAAFLAEAGCDLLQGYLFCRPVPAETFRELCAGEARWALDGRRLDTA